MINQNELRIGNIIHFPFISDNVKVVGLALVENDKQIRIQTTISGSHNFFELAEKYTPIPLTEEWLLRAGFTSDDYKTGYIGIDVHNKNGMSTDFVLSYPGRMGEFQKYFAWEFNNYMFNKIEFVHELQNFYSAMTDYELSFSTEP